MLHRVFALGLLVLPGCALGPERAPASAPPPYRPLAPAALPAEEPAAVAFSYHDGEALAFGEEPAAIDDDIDDEPDALAPSPGPVSLRQRTTPQSPLLSLSDAELADRYKHDPASVGPISAGPARSGVLVNGVQMPKSEKWLLLDPGRAWGTRETVDALSHIITRVHERYPATPQLPIGHISAQRGGHLNPHVSHQSGRDADVGYYYRAPIRAFVSATSDNLDMPRTWALVKSAILETDVEMVLMDSSIQKLLADYAALNGEDPNFIDQAFQIRGKNARAPIRHIKGHKNHLHFRFWSPVAQELGRRLARHIVIPKRHVAPSHHNEVAGVVLTQHKARSGDTLVVLARRYGTTVEDIQRANGLKSNALRAGTVYKIPHKGSAKAPLAKGGPAKGAPAKGPRGKGSSAKGAPAKGALHKGAVAKGPPVKGPSAHEGGRGAKHGNVAKRSAPSRHKHGSGRNASSQQR